MRKVIIGTDFFQGSTAQLAMEVVIHVHVMRGDQGLHEILRFTVNLIC